MGTPGLFIVVVIGLAAGALGRWIVRGRQSRFGSLAAGLMGAAIAVPAATALGHPVSGPGAMALATLAGAIVVLGAWTLLRRR